MILTVIDLTCIYRKMQSSGKFIINLWLFVNVDFELKVKYEPNSFMFDLKEYILYKCTIIQCIGFE